MREEVLILASSFKGGGRCVAGKTVAGKKWIRPVGDSGGELSEALLRSVTKAEPNKIVCGVYNLPFAAPRPEKHQTENRTVGGGEWRLLKRLRYGDLRDYEDAAETLWKIKERSDRMTPGEAQAHGFSLRLIKAANAQLEENPENPRRKKARFACGGEDYFLSVTAPEVNNMSAPCVLPECYICVSLCNPWNEGDGLCYKIAASVITPESFQ